MAAPLWVTWVLLISLSGHLSAGQRRAEDQGRQAHARSACVAAREAAAGWTDVYVPSCTNSGLFERRQCQPFIRQCWCVDPVTGTEVENTRKHYGEGVIDCEKYAKPRALARVANATRPSSRPSTAMTSDGRGSHDSEEGAITACQAAQLAAAGWPDAFVPRCIESSGLFRWSQCHMFIQQCWCVYPETGIEIENSRQPYDNPIIDCQKYAQSMRRATQSTTNTPLPSTPTSESETGEGHTLDSPCLAAQLAVAGETDTFMPLCTESGLYERKQCHYYINACWCVDPDSGIEVEGSRKSLDEGNVKCDQPDRPTDPCHVALSRTRPLVGAYVPQCTSDGKYEKRQCHGSTGYCWCVNEDGIEVEGTKKGPGLGPVDCEEAKPIGPCHVALARTLPLMGAYVPQCTLDGKYEKRQCHGSTGYCWCVNGDGVEVEGTRKGPGQGPVACEEAEPTREDTDGNVTPPATALPPTSSTAASRQTASVPLRSCSLPPAVGSCQYWRTHWYFDRETETCKEFVYGGCEGNANNFGSKTECEFACPPNGCPAVDCRLTCFRGFQHDANNCRLCSCDDDPCSKVDCAAGQMCRADKVDGDGADYTWTVRCYDIKPEVPSYCALPFDAGTCNNRTARWYFSSSPRMCKEFTYGGCGGNRNNFAYQSQCERTCMNQCSQNHCWKPCPFGYKKDATGCDSCECLYPCSGVKCPTGETCVARKLCNTHPCEIVTECKKVDSAGRTSSVSAVCTDPADVGRGGAQYPRFYYNEETKECRLFYYRGRGGSRNNFDTKKDCERTCVPAACPRVSCRMECPFGFVRGEDGCNICQCANPCKNVTCPQGKRCQPELPYCATPPCVAVARCLIVRPELPGLCSYGFNAGHCSTRVQKWFYNITSDQCQMRNFTICRGNANRFDSKDQCAKKCKSITCPPIECPADICPFGLRKDEHGCNICQCFNPCENTTCKTGERCMSEMESCEFEQCPFVGKCHEVPSPVGNARCALPRESGWCSARESRWFYNKTSKQCQPFNYTGCHGNDNRFETRADCEQACSTHQCRPVRCRMDCPFGWAKDHNGCDICRCMDPCKNVTCPENQSCLPERRPCLTTPCPAIGQCFVTRPSLNRQCTLAIDVGRCRSRERKWFFNMTSNACEAFNYTGCRGNYNRFSSMMECQQTCKPQRCEPPTCEEDCPFGQVKDVNGCDTCRCIRPCENVTCSEGEHCVPVRMECHVSPCPAVGICQAKTPDVKCPPVTCRMLCPFEWAKDKNGCSICICLNPCTGVRCADNEMCLPERKYCSKSPCPVVAKCFPKRPDLDHRCSLAVEAGRCESRERKWFFNMTSNACEEFNYTGCRGNYNRFSSMMECQRTCKPQRCEPPTCEEDCPFGQVKDVNGCDTCRCIKPCENITCADGEHCVPQHVECIRSPCPAIGKCLAKTSEVRCRPVMCRMFCPFGWAKNENGCNICRCYQPCKDVVCKDNERCLPERKYCSKSPCPVVGKCFVRRPDLEPRCSLALEVGLCHSPQKKWFFNLTSSKCEPFNYTGCRGNRNRFESEEACRKTCNGCAPPACQQFCPYGFVKDDKGCDMCRCINPCVGVSCTGGKRCFPERLACHSTATPCPVTAKCIAVRSNVAAFCSVPADFGLCANRTRRWYFDTEADQCVEFIYSGCRGNMNNFQSASQCSAACRSTFCPPPSCDLRCEFGLERDSRGCAVCSCRDPCKGIACSVGTICDKKQGKCVLLKIVPADCKLPPHTGMCRAYFRRWFYNATVGACERFVYGGCQANANNFKTKNECEETCLPAPCPDVSDCGWCEHGLAKDDRGCATCKCSDNPCAVVDCADNMKCEVVKGNCSGPACQTVAKCVSYNETRCPPFVCALYCEYEFVRGPDGCRICRCQDPCHSVNCGAGFVCQVKKCSSRDPKCRSVGICVPLRHVVKPGLCPEIASMGPGICAEMCSFDESCPDMQKCCSNNCGHICMNPVFEHDTTRVPAYTTPVATVVTKHPGVCPVHVGPGKCVQECSDDSSCLPTQKCCSNGCALVCMEPAGGVCQSGMAWRNCSGVCEKASCDKLQSTRDKTNCRADPCNECHFVIYSKAQTEICSGWLCPEKKESRLCDERKMCASGPNCLWMPDAKCVDDFCNCQAKFVNLYGQDVSCDKEMSTCQRKRSLALANSKVVSDVWMPECDESGNFKPEQVSYGGTWCVDPLGHVINDSVTQHSKNGLDCTMGNFTRVFGQLRLDADYDYMLVDRAQFISTMEIQLADAMMVDPTQVEIIKVAAGSIILDFSIGDQQVDKVNFLAKADRFERLVHAGKLRLMYKGIEIPLAKNSANSFKFGFIYSDEPTFGARKEELSRGVIIAITVVVCAVLLSMMLVCMVCLARRHRKLYEIKEKPAIPAFENPRYMTADEIKLKQ